jgi:hypothetical protein
MPSIINSTISFPSFLQAFKEITVYFSSVPLSPLTHDLEGKFVLYIVLYILWQMLEILIQILKNFSFITIFFSDSPLSISQNYRHEVWNTIV